METQAHMSYKLWNSGGVFSSPATVTGPVTVPGLCPCFLPSEDTAKEEDWGGRGA